MRPWQALSITVFLLMSLLIAQQLIAYASDTVHIAEVLVTVDSVRDKVRIAVHMGSDDPAHQAEVSDALLKILGSSPGSFDLTRNESGVYISVTVKGVLRYIASDEELFINYMNYTIPNNPAETCLSALGRTGFDLSLLIPDELQKIIDNVGAGSIVFRIVSPYLNESALGAVAEEIAQYLPGNVSVSGNTLVIALDNASAPACVPYEDWFWKLFGAPRAVATIPPPLA